MNNMNSGYSGYSMSNRAVEAYYNGEKPLSKWTKADIIDAVKAYAAEEPLYCPIEAIKKAPAQVLKNLLLYRTSWHHTSSYCNSTDFYSVNLTALSELTEGLLLEKTAAFKDQKDKPAEANKYKGNIKYLEWSGTRKHPKATTCELMNVNIEEKGCFYIVTDNAGKQLLKKKIGSNGTYVSKI